MQWQQSVSKGKETKIEKKIFLQQNLLSIVIIIKIQTTIIKIAKSFYRN